jgi:hypothetical protein
MKRTRILSSNLTPIFKLISYRIGAFRRRLNAFSRWVESKGPKTRRAKDKKQTLWLNISNRSEVHKLQAFVGPPLVRRLGMIWLKHLSSIA